MGADLTRRGRVCCAGLWLVVSLTIGEKPGEQLLEFGAGIFRWSPKSGIPFLDAEGNGDGGAPGDDKAVDLVEIRGLLQGEGFEEALGEQMRQKAGKLGLPRERKFGDGQESSVEPQAAGVAVEGGEAEAGVGEAELVIDGAMGGRVSIDDGPVDLPAEVGGEFFEDGGVEVEGREGSLIAGAVLVVHDRFLLTATFSSDNS